MNDPRSRLLRSRLSRRRFRARRAGGGGAPATKLPGGTGNAAAKNASRQDLALDPNGVIDLPKGFQYKVLAGDASTPFNTIYSDGTPRPGDADGMGAFPGPNNTTILCLNHELSNSEQPVVPPVADNYDPDSSGGTSVMQIGPNREVLQAYVSSSGTIRNCAGGVTPWNTWITCEENESINGIYTHGWNFEVDPYAPLNGGTPRQARLDSLGRGYWEAITVDPSTYATYATEDRSDGLYYRFIPDAGFQPGYGAYASAAGTLSAAYIPGLPDANAASQGDIYYPEWIPVPDPTGIPVRMRYQDYTVNGLPAGESMTRFYRGEGSWWSEQDQAVYWDCTGGGGSGHDGQIWRYTPATNELELVYVSDDPNVLDRPDNLLVLPWGDVMLCEDGGGEQYLRILTQDGEIIDFARNAYNNNEFAGACFSTSPDTLYVNIQGPSITLAIWGPWPQVQK